MNFNFLEPPTVQLSQGLRLKSFSAVFIVLLFGSVLAGYALLSGRIDSDRYIVNQAPNYNGVVQAQTRPPEDLKDEESQTVGIVKMTSPAVVSIIASGEVPKIERCDTSTDQYGRLPPNFMQYFYQPMYLDGYCQNGTVIKRIGSASGFIVSQDGYIVTNQHVVNDEEADYTVVLNDEKHKGQKVKAKVVARDAVNDVAVIKIGLNNLPFLNFGNSDQLEVGQTALTIGYALGEFDNTVSKGVISGLSRSISAYGSPEGPEQLRNLIQTDAAINPGNSGGPLININGEVIGMNVAVADLAQSIGFAIPANTIKNSFEQVRRTGVITPSAKAFLGIWYNVITPELQVNNKLPFNYGMFVTKNPKDQTPAVIKNSPADKAGIVENDIIMEADGKQLNEQRVLQDVIAEHKPGDQITLKVYHNGAVKEVTVTLDKK